MVNQQSNIAFYLKYRPLNLDELVGQETVKKIIQGSFKENKLSHAYLFVGPRGTGKTSTARILAKMVNCEKAFSDSQLAIGNDKANSEKLTAKSEYPCNECTTCLSITNGSSLDLIEIDAASNRGVEDIRALREKVKLSPSSAKKKVYILDEVHMLTTEAFNALLKTLEEPPNHALFILATTDSQKIPQTILSRVQRLDFKLASYVELMEALKRIAEKEKIGIDEEALKLLVKKAEGSYRDGIKFLDQISSIGEKITIQLLEKSLRSTNFEILYDLIKIFGKKDITSGLSLVLKQIEGGVDSKELTLSLMDILRDLVFIKNGLGNELVKENLLDENYQSLIKVSENFENRDLISILNTLQTALEKMKSSSIPSLPLELAMVEICGSNPLEYTANKPESDTVAVEQKKANLVDIPTDDIPNHDIQKLKEKWTFVLETVRAFNFSLEALLRSINIKECTLASVIMEVPYSFHQRILESPKNRDLIESVISDVLGRSIKVLTTLGSRPQRKEDIANIEVAADDEIIRAAAEIFSSDTLSS